MRHLIFGLILLSTVATAAEYPLVLDPYATATPPGATVSAGYFSLTNQGDENITITDAYSPDVVKVEIHLSTVVNDVAKMEKQLQVEIPAGTTLEFEHGSYHIMLMGLTEPLVEGSTVDLILVTSVGDMLIELPVKKLSAMTMEKHDDSKMGDIEMKEPVKIVH